MEEREFRLYGKSRDEAIAAALRKTAASRIVALRWPPLHDSEGWRRLRELGAARPTVFITRTFEDAKLTTRAYEDYIERYFRFVQNAAEYDRSETIHGFQATMRTCKSCSSHVAVELVPGEACPVCGADLRSATVQKTLARWEERIAKVLEQAEGEAEKAGWLGGWIGIASEGGARPAEPAAGDGAAPAGPAGQELLRKYDSVASLPAQTGEDRVVALSRQAWDALSRCSDLLGLAPSRCVEALARERLGRESGGESQEG